MELIAGLDTYTWPTPYFFTITPPDINGSPLPTLNVDLRTIFRLRLHCQFFLKEYNVSMVYLQKENVQRVHILADNLNTDSGGFCPIKKKITQKDIDLLIDIVEQITGFSRYKNLSIEEARIIEPSVPKNIKYSYVPLFRREQLPGWLSFFCVRQFPNIYILDDVIYLDLNRISNLSNYTQIYNSYSERFLQMLNYIEDKRIICTNNLNFVKDWELMSLPSGLVEPYKDIIGNINGLFLPNFEESLDFWEARLLNKPYYFYTGKSPVVAHMIALNTDIWVIDGYIELPMKNSQDYQKVKQIRKILINSSGSIYLTHFTDKNFKKAKSYSPLSIGTYYLGRGREKILSLLFPINKVPPEIDFN